MPRRTTALAAALSLLPIGQPLLLGSTTALATAAVVLSTQAAHAQSAGEFFNRGNAKYRLRDYQGAIADYTKAIQIDPQDAFSYVNRGNAKKGLGDHQGAIADYSKAIEINPQYANAYKNRGIAKELVRDLKGACADWKEASSIGDQDAAGWVRDQCQ